MKKSRKEKLSIEKVKVARLTNLRSILGGTDGTLPTDTDTGNGTQTNTNRPKSTGNPLCRTRPTTKPTV